MRMTGSNLETAGQTVL